jgi:alkanesulfonate monooxygenase SsuD/methylene tetrahydromethanopterin reductase-like flavin-dependent oxidoreductase (luciferase family)
MKFGVLLPGTVPVGGELLARADEASSLDHLVVTDHVSFRGRGDDALIRAASYLSATKRLSVYVGVYLLALRHPVLVARQLSTIASMAPGRLVFGVGVGGEDPHEFEICGVDPTTRGRRTNEALEIVQQLLTGRPFTFKGRFFEFARAEILPVPPQAVPIVVGGRSEQALRRVARFADGWLAAWVGADRFAKGVCRIKEEADRLGRKVAWRHGIQLWCGFGTSREAARIAVARPMERFYGMPFSRFEKYTPYGSPQAVAQFLRPYIDSQCSTVNLIVQSSEPVEALEQALELRHLLV